MKVDKIKEYIVHFKKHLMSSGTDEMLFKWEVQKNFQQNWEGDASDMASMFHKALSSKKSGRLWGGSQDSAKSVMIEFMEMNPLFVQAMFKDLFDENKDITMRIERFKFHCDQLLEDLQKIRKKANHHYHGETKIISLYLALNTPAQYTIFDYEPFKKTMQAIEARTMPAAYDVERFFKTAKIFDTFIRQDEELIDFINKEIESDEYYHGYTMYLAYDFYQYVAKNVN